MISFLLSIYLGVELLGHMVTLTFEKLLDYFSKQLHHFIFPLVMCKGSKSSPALVIVFLIIAVLVIISL